MKIHLISALSLGLVCVASCTKDIESPVDNNAVSDCTITAYTYGSSTKTELGEGNTVLWSDGDRIAVAADGESTADCFTLTSGAGSTTGTFSGTLSSPEKAHAAFYPYNEKNVYVAASEDVSAMAAISWDNGKAVPFLQTAVPGGFDPEASLMMGFLDDEANISFKNLCAYFKFTPDFPCTSIKIISNDDMNLVSDQVALMGFDENGVPGTIAGMPTPGSGNVGVTLVGPAGDNIEPGTYMIAVLPQTLEKGFTIQFNTPSGNTFTKSTDKEVVLQRSHILNLGEFSIMDCNNGKFEGSGTSEDPYIIYSKLCLQTLAEYLSGSKYDTFAKACYLQTADIDCSGDEIQIGIEGKTFQGTYDGGGHTISNFVPASVWDKTGLFREVYNGSIKNLTVSPNSIELFNPDDHQASCGGIVAVATSDAGTYVTIENCHFTAPENVLTVQVPENMELHFGGIVGISLADIRVTGCTNDVVLNFTPKSTGSSRVNRLSVGGIVGRQKSTGTRYIKVDRCRNNADLTATYYTSVSVGGIIGHIEENSWGDDEVALYLTNCVNKASIYARSTEGNDTRAGGLVGDNDADGWYDVDPYIINCLNTGAIQAEGLHGYAGGILGCNYDEDTHVILCAVTGTVQGAYKGILSGGSNLTYDYCYWNDPTSQVYAGHDQSEEESSHEIVFNYQMNDTIKDVKYSYPDVDFCNWTGRSSVGTLDLIF